MVNVVCATGKNPIPQPQGHEEKSRFPFQANQGRSKTSDSVTKTAAGLREGGMSRVNIKADNGQVICSQFYLSSSFLSGFWKILGTGSCQMD